MFAKELISDAVVPLKTSDTCMQALNLMDEFRVAHLPVVNNASFLGLISEEDIISYNNFEEPIGSCPVSSANTYVDVHQHLFDVMRLMANERLTLIPVLDNQLQYVGVITLEDLLQNFAEVSSLAEPGGIIVLERNLNNYSMTEIAQIIESNDAKILGAYVTTNHDTTKIFVSIKVNRMDLSSILQTFDRYNYIVTVSFGEGSYYDSLKERYDHLMNYLNL